MDTVPYLALKHAAGSDHLVFFSVSEQKSWSATPPPRPPTSSTLMTGAPGSSYSIYRRITSLP